ncbi:mucin-7-like isoform X1 [Lucilia sericata]|uniref:mucin-7-like isoform X1 n=1 Tax=Lucilia sericata TaxID=13632 RepID=UPI0018A87849|nr:mucin-7-like isoform X1 [Lucilia sericata]
MFIMKKDILKAGMNDIIKGNNRRGRGRSRTTRGGWRSQVPDVALYQRATVWPQQNYNATYGQPPIVLLPPEYTAPTHLEQYIPTQYYDYFSSYPQYEYNHQQYYNQQPTYMPYPPVHAIPRSTLPSATTTAPPLPQTAAPPLPQTAAPPLPQTTAPPPPPTIAPPPPPITAPPSSEAFSTTSATIVTTATNCSNTAAKLRTIFGYISTIG